MSTSRVSTRPALARSSSSSSNSFSGSAHAFAAHAHLVTRRVEAHVTDLDDLAAVGHRAVVGTTTAERGAHARDQLPQPERLRHVVVGADLEADDRVDLGVARRHHDDRHLRP